MDFNPNTYPDPAAQIHNQSTDQWSDPDRGRVRLADLSRSPAPSKRGTGSSTPIPTPPGAGVLAAAIGASSPSSYLQDIRAPISIPRKFISSDPSNVQLQSFTSPFASPLSPASTPASTPLGKRRSSDPEKKLGQPSGEKSPLMSSGSPSPYSSSSDISPRTTPAIKSPPATFSLHEISEDNEPPYVTPHASNEFAMDGDKDPLLFKRVGRYGRLQSIGSTPGPSVEEAKQNSMFQKLESAHRREQLLPDATLDDENSSALTPPNIEQTGINPAPLEEHGPISGIGDTESKGTDSSVIDVKLEGESSDEDPNPFAPLKEKRADKEPILVQRRSSTFDIDDTYSMTQEENRSPFINAIRFVTKCKAQSDPGRHACNVTNFFAKMSCSVFPTTFIREMILQKVTVSPIVNIYLGVGVTALLVLVTAAGLVGDRVVGKLVDKIAADFCEAMEQKIVTIAARKGIALDQSKLREFFSSIRKEIFSHIQSAEEINVDAYKDLFKNNNMRVASDDIASGPVLSDADLEEIHAEIDQLFSDALATLAKQLEGKYWDTDATVTIRLLSIVTLLGLGFGTWYMDLLKDLGFTMTVLTNYCNNRDGIQLFVRTKEKGVDKFHTIPTLGTGFFFGFCQSIFNMWGRWLAGHFVNPVVIAFIKALSNALFEVIDAIVLAYSHAGLAGKPLRVKLQAKVPTKMELAKAVTGIGNARPVLYYGDVAGSEFLKTVLATYAAYVISPTGMDWLTGSILGLFYIFLLIWAVRAGFGCSSDKQASITVK